MMLPTYVSSGGSVRPGLQGQTRERPRLLLRTPDTFSSSPSHCGWWGWRDRYSLTDSELIKQCIDECTARIEIGLHYQIPYPRPIHLPPTALTPLQSRGLQTQEKLRRLSKPLYLKSHNEVS
ncbi:LYR motif-containing protein 1 isoform X4 [Petaurus breviceps papuanus]|uniref:LYR motif-containing protein 1 isoform X4 n=1 Tax=Petaurus breviceps papuanus TaxID=3040969 RepID=UPI0036DACA57